MGQASQCGWPVRAWKRPSPHSEHSFEPSDEWRPTCKPRNRCEIQAGSYERQQAYGADVAGGLPESGSIRAGLALGARALAGLLTQENQGQTESAIEASVCTVSVYSPGLQAAQSELPLAAEKRPGLHSSQSPD
jgi:hypothetical protein